jgi:hypothetical protein
MQKDTATLDFDLLGTVEYQHDEDDEQTEWTIMRRRTRWHDAPRPSSVDVRNLLDALRFDFKTSL